MHHSPAPSPNSVLTLRLHSGLSGDMFLAGLLCMQAQPQDELDALTDGLLRGLVPDRAAELAGAVRLVPHSVQGIGGWQARVALPHEHAHRNLADVQALIRQSPLQERARKLALDAFGRVAHAEAAVHGKALDEVHFHEVGALDSIVDICLTCELFARLDPGALVVSPLPLADGSVTCAHGVLPVPAPAVLRMLEGMPVRPFPGEGETITPTAIALLQALRADFGPWPHMRVERCALVYGTRVFPHAPNGATFALGEALVASCTPPCGHEHEHGHGHEHGHEHGHGHCHG